MMRYPLWGYSSAGAAASMPGVAGSGREWPQARRSRPVVEWRTTSMAELTYDDLRALRRRIGKGELTIEQAATQYSLDVLAEALRMTRATLQALAEGWSQAQLTWQPPAAQSATPADGEDRWSATEAITHMLMTQNWYLLHMGRLVGKREHFETLPRGLGDQADNTVPKAELEARLSAATDRML